MKNCGELAGKKAFIAGAGRGIGRAVALQLSGMGASVVCAARTRIDLDSLARELSGSDNFMIVADLASGPGIEKMMSYFHDTSFPDIVVAAVDVHRPLAKVGSEEFDISPEKLAETFQYLNTLFPLALQHQRANNFGRWIHVSSIVAQMGGPGQALYIARKNIINSVFRNIAVENGMYNITANSVLPGLILTEGLLKKYGKAVVDKLSGKNLMKRAGLPEEVACAVGFLASPQASYITGIDLPVCGGYNLSWSL